MTTDTMREKFEEWEANVDDEDLCARFRKSEFVSFDNFMLFEAYQQGQRDLIEAMGELVAWQISIPGSPELGDWMGNERSETLHSVPLYRLPEDTPK